MSKSLLSLVIILVFSTLCFADPPKYYRHNPYPYRGPDFHHNYRPLPHYDYWRKPHPRYDFHFKGEGEKGKKKFGFNFSLDL